jgi:hypothetical protein
MRILLWATHLQTDMLALACHLDRCPDIELLIVVPGMETFLGTPFARFSPFGARLLDRDDAATLPLVRSFGADVAVADNHVPPKGSAPRLFYMWHGMGWKARSRLDLHIFYRQVRHMIGQDPRLPSPSFLAQCYGPTDRDWRVARWKLPASSCASVGMLFSDLLAAPPYSKSDVASDYKIDVLSRKTVLLSITWHQGEIFAAPAAEGKDDGRERAAVNAADRDFIQSLMESVEARGANLLICLHDRHRYDPAFVRFVEALANRHPFVEARFKSSHPDNLSDLLVADVMISNLSSFLAYFYLLGRPAIHILPASARDRTIRRMVMLFSRWRVKRRVKTEDAWMLDPTDTGGPRVFDSAQARAAVERALEDPSWGLAESTSWLRRHIPALDGQAGARAEMYLRQMCGDAGLAAGPETLAQDLPRFALQPGAIRGRPQPQVIALERNANMLEFGRAIRRLFVNDQASPPA